MMLYEALVIDNKPFYSKGKIIVRIPNFYHRNMNWDLSSEYPDLIEESEIDNETEQTNDFEAFVYSPYGGGRNFGVFFLPQINQKGLVMPIGQGQTKFVWLGSFFEAVRDDNFNVEYANIPSDDPVQKDGSTSGEQSMDAENEEEALGKNFVARFKTTNSDSQEGVDWGLRPTSNIITIGDKKAKITHFSEEDGWDEDTPQKWQEISIEKNEDGEDEITNSIVNDVDTKKSKISLKESSFNVEVDNNGDISKFYVANDDEGISFYFEDSYGNIITLNTNDGIKVETEGTIKINGASDTAVLYSQLKKIIEALEGHIHIAPSGPTASPLNPDQSPITAKTTKPKNDMESESTELD